MRGLSLLFAASLAACASIEPSARADGMIERALALSETICRQDAPLPPWESTRLDSVFDFRTYHGAQLEARRAGPVYLDPETPLVWEPNEGGCMMYLPGVDQAVFLSRWTEAMAARRLQTGAEAIAGASGDFVGEEQISVVPCFRAVFRGERYCEGNLADIAFHRRVSDGALFITGAADEGPLQGVAAISVYNPRLPPRAH